MRYVERIQQLIVPVLGACILLGFYASSLHSYLLFHVMVELFAIGVALGMFLIVWNTRGMMDNAYLLFLGVAYAAIAGVDFAHTLAYKGMEILPGFDANAPTQLWIGARYLQAASLLIAPFTFGRTIRMFRLVFGYAFLVGLLLLSVFLWRIFPDCYVERVGLTEFKIFSEYLICVLLLLALLLMVRKRSRFELQEFRWMVISILTTVLGELAFTRYINVYSNFNLLGHYLKLLSFYCLYRAMIVTALNRPFQMLFRNLHNSEAALRQSEAHKRALLDAMPDLIFQICSDGTFLAVHGSPDDLYVEKSQIIGRNLKALLPSENAEMMMHYIQKTLKSAQMQNCEYQLPMPAGMRQYEARMVPVGPDEVIASVRDVTRHKQIEEQLRQAKEAAEAANQSKNVFLATMSHELRTPLNGILGYAQVLRHDPALTPRQLNGVQVIEKSGHHLLTLINDVLDLAKIESGKIELLLKNFHLGAFLEDVCEIVRIRAEQKGLSFLLEQEEGLPRVVCGDERRLRQVLLNVLGNAVKFTQQGHITLRVGRRQGSSMIDTRPQTAELAKVPMFRFDVEDTGIGIPVEKLREIFDPFLQAGNDEQRVQGTGLGLAISQKFTRLMGGELQVTSTCGQGSLFFFEIPLSVSESQDSTPLPDDRMAVGIKGEAPTILVVDQNRQDRSVFAELLLPSGCHLLEAETGCEALELAVSALPDVVLTALMLPDMSGFELIEALRKIPDLRELVILASSASVYGKDLQQSLKVGANAFLPKPVNAGQLFEMLQQCLGMEWIYQESKPISISFDTGDLGLLPPPNQLEELLDLARIGDVGALQRILDGMQLSGEGALPFVMKLRTLLKRFRLDELRKVLEESFKSAQEHHVAEEGVEKTLEWDTLFQLPTRIREDLKFAAESALFDEALRQIDDIRDRAPALADHLEELVKHYRFEEILSMLEERESQMDQHSNIYESAREKPI